jgi:hypothetical protein
MRWLLLALTLVSCEDCDDEETEVGHPLASAAQTDDSIKPVYPASPIEIPALVSRLCKALHEVPKRKRAECCNSTPGVMVTRECERNLAGAITSGGVSLDEANVAACEQAIEAMHATCDWIGPWQPPAPTACLGILSGARNAGEPCRSNLECMDSHRCIGAGPTDQGVCGEPPPPGSLCGAAVDPLAVYARQDDAELRHPPCGDGYCDRARCVALIEDGQECKASVQCKSGRCVEGKCTAEGCSGGDCAPGSRCIDSKCQEPKSLGEECTDSRECKSGCIAGKCAMECTNPAITRGLIKTQ